MRLSLIAILVCLSASLSAQNVIGYSTVEAKTYFKSHYPDLVFEAKLNNAHYRYLKYSDMNSNLITALVFLDKKGECTSVRFFYDLSLEEKVIEELNSKFKKVGRDNWVDSRKGGKVKIVYKKEDWFVTVNYKAE